MFMNLFWSNESWKSINKSEELNLEIPEGDYQTLAGFILDRLGRIPEVGDVMEYGDLRFTIKVMERVRIEEVELRRLNSLNITSSNEVGQ